ncbi:hypothetical protein VTK73DRAFT_5648 [Phialemonium thermophilum]|uniref:Mitochondrial distribution and morphology protein 31 n=1 Tax=Phialemonium thermophilum TaxID=223376 RepID=A0ABR3WMZ0_9PEZI
MSSSASATQFGRHLWASFRSSAPPFRRRPFQQPGLSRPSALANQSSPSRPFHSYRSSRHSSGRDPRSSNVRRSSVSGGLLLITLTSGSSSTPSCLAACQSATDAALLPAASQKASIGSLARLAWRDAAQARTGIVSARLGRRGASSKSDAGSENTPPPAKETAHGTREPPSTVPPKSNQDPPAPDHESLANSMSKYLHLHHLPKMPHRPTKEELLAAASGFWQRLKVRFKWFSIRSMRPWNADEWGAFVSWFLFGHLVWVLVGTTTFFSLIILFINTVFAQETLAKWIGDYLTQSAGLTVVFESAIVPKWGDGVISLKNVFVSRRPGQVQSSVKKGSSNAAAEAAALRLADQDASGSEVEDDGNYTQFDVTMDTVNVTLSFLKWWNGKGLLKGVEIKGVRGVVDRTSVRWSQGEDVDPLSYRHEHNPGDFELDYFKMEDLLVTVHQPGGFRPFPVSIYSCELPQLRKQWLFYDFLAATHMSGSFDGSLFTIHPRQIHGVVGPVGSRLDEESAWKKFSRIRIDGLKIDHLNRGVEGPFGWIYEGNVDIIADIMFPPDADEGIGKVVADFYDKMEEAVTSNRYVRMLENNNNNSNSNNGSEGREAGGLAVWPSDNLAETDAQRHVLQAEASPQLASQSSSTAAVNASPLEETPAYLVMDLRIHLNDVRAAVPLFNNPHISYVNQALVRPIVAYINAKRTYIPINCRIVKRLTDFDGSWSVYDCGLMDDLSAEVYAAFARDVEDQQSRVRRLKRVGLWTMSLVVHALLAGVAGDLM